MTMQEFGKPISRPNPTPPKARREPKKKYLKVPKLPPTVDQILQSLIEDVPVGSSIYDALVIDPSVLGSMKTVKAKVLKNHVTPPAGEQSHRSGSPSAADLARNLAVANVMEDVSLPVPPPFRGATLA